MSKKKKRIKKIERSLGLLQDQINSIYELYKALNGSIKGSDWAKYGSFPNCVTEQIKKERNT